MNARYYADQILERSINVMRMQDHAERDMIRSALREIVIDVATTIADRTAQVMNQQYGLGTKHVGFIMRDLKKLWTAVIKSVKQRYDDHPISERLLHIVMLTDHAGRQNAWPGIIKSDLSPEHRYFLANATKADRKWRINKVLSEII